MKALNNILLDLPVQLDTLVCVALMLPIYLPRTPPLYGTCHLRRPIALVTLQGCTDC
jgi:hypothetical protein